MIACGEEAPQFSPVVAEPTTKVEFLRQADAICHSSEAQIEAAGDDLLSAGGQVTRAQITRIAKEVIAPALRAEVAAIAALEPPPGDEGKIAAILAATEAGIEALEANPAVFEDGPPPPLRRAQQLAEAYGSRQCGFRG